MTKLHFCHYLIAWEILKHEWIRAFFVLIKMRLRLLCLVVLGISACVDALGNLGLYVCPFTRNLGVIFDSAFKFEKQISSVVSQALSAA